MQREGRDGCEGFRGAQSACKGAMKLLCPSAHVKTDLYSYLSAAVPLAQEKIESHRDMVYRHRQQCLRAGPHLHSPPATFLLGRVLLVHLYNVLSEDNAV